MLNTTEQLLEPQEQQQPRKVHGYHQQQSLQ